MLDKILEMKNVSVIDKKKLQTVKGGDVTAFLLCLRQGGNWCHPDIH